MDLQQLKAFEEIRLAKARYCRLIDQKQWDDFRKLFMPEIHLRFHGVDGTLLHEYTVLSDFIEQTANLLKNAQTIHQVHNPEIELTSATTAHAIWSMEDRIIFPDGVTGPFLSMHGNGHYEETLEKVHNRWLIRTLTLTRTILNIS
jgi:SnoaL-like domain